MSADSQGETTPTNTQQATTPTNTQQATTSTNTQQATTPTPTTMLAKNPKRVAAGKMVAERTRAAREAQKKAYLEKIAARESAHLAPLSPPKTETAPEPAAANSKYHLLQNSNGLSTTTWISIIGIGATLFTTYVKREDIKTFFRKKPATAPELAPQVRMQASPQPSIIPQPKKGLRSME